MSESAREVGNRLIECVAERETEERGGEEVDRLIESISKDDLSYIMWKIINSAVKVRS